MFDSISHIGLLIHLGHQFEIMDTLANGDADLVSINHSGKRLAFLLTDTGNRQQIRVLREEHSVERSGALE